MVHDVKQVSLTSADLALVCAIEKQVFKQPWSRRNFEDELAALSSLTVALQPIRSVGRTISGYLFGRLWVEELHILKLAVAPAWQRQGLGSEMVAAAIGRARAQQAQTAWIEVRRSNQAAIDFYQNLGFAIAGKRINYYHNPLDHQREDALIMKRNIKEKR
jgi:ribosomal-protein-alanine N-acetyltransferase